MFFEWMSDPSAWAGLATLVALEIVLGIDNLVFIAILTDRLPPQQRERARLTGLSLALITRLGLLASIAWIVTLTEPLFTLFSFEFSGRGLIFVIGGLFLLFKSTTELHQRLEGMGGQGTGKGNHAVFWQVIVQIVVLDAVFSLDSVVTAVGMVDHLAVMMVAVVIAVGIMMLSSGPLMTFISRHPTVVILCLGFLLMIGFSLIVEGFGYPIPKGYLYAAISFSVLIELFNQVARRNMQKLAVAGDLRGRTADAVLRLLGGKTGAVRLGGAADVIAERAQEEGLFAPEEKEMIQGVLTLADRPVVSIMTPRTDIDWLDIEAGQEALKAALFEHGHSRFLLARGQLDDFVGVALAKDLMRDLLEEGRINLGKSMRQPLIVHERISALRVMEQLRKAPLQMAVIADEYGSLQGIATPTDILEAIAGEFPDEGETPLAAEFADDGSWLVDGWIDIRKASNLFDANLVDEADRYSTLAGYILWRLGHLPEVGESVNMGELNFEVEALKGRNIEKVRVRSIASTG